MNEKEFKQFEFNRNIQVIIEELQKQIKMIDQRLRIIEEWDREL